MAKMVNALAQMAMTHEMKGTKAKGTANGEIHTYFISGEELEKYRALPAPIDTKTKAKIW